MAIVKLRRGDGKNYSGARSIVYPSKGMFLQKDTGKGEHAALFLIRICWDLSAVTFYIVLFRRTNKLLYVRISGSTYMYKDVWQRPCYFPADGFVEDVNTEVIT
jgi:hypothetical protein